jgi:transposase-like protein
MTQRKGKRTLEEIKELIKGEEDYLRPVVSAVVQEILEVEMSEALGEYHELERVPGEA